LQELHYVIFPNRGESGGRGEERSQEGRRERGRERSQEGSRERGRERSRRWSREKGRVRNKILAIGQI